MDAKLRAAELLVQKLSQACDSAKLEAVAEIRLFSKWDDRNRLSLAQAGAIPVLIQLINHENATSSGGACADNSGSLLSAKAMVALLNLSLHPHNKLPILQSPGSLDSIIRTVGCDALSSDTRGTAAALLQSLMEDRSNIGGPSVALHPGLVKCLVKLLKDGGGKAKADALRALYQAIATTTTAQAGSIFKEELLREGAVSLLLKLVACGRPKLAEDCFALLVEMARGEGAACMEIVGNAAALPLAIRAMDQGAENAVALLLELCVSGGSAAVSAMLGGGDSSVVLAAARLASSPAASPRAKQKADALLRAIGHQYAATSAPASLCNPPLSTPVMPSGIRDSYPPPDSAPGTKPPHHPKAPTNFAFNKFFSRAFRSLERSGKHNNKNLRTSS